MVAGPDHTGSAESKTGTGEQYRVDPLTSDPSTMVPLCSEEEFAAEVADLVAAEAPRLFAVVQEYGDRVDGRVAAWGMAFDDHASIVLVDRHCCVKLPATEQALGGFTVDGYIRARLVWLDRQPSGPATASAIS